MEKHVAGHNKEEKYCHYYNKEKACPYDDLDPNMRILYIYEVVQFIWSKDSRGKCLIRHI